MNSKTEHSFDDSDVSDEDFPPFVEPVRSTRQAHSAGLSATDIQLNAISRDTAMSASGLGSTKRLSSDLSASPILEQLGPWRIEREIGRGGMGIVYEAVHVETQVHAALKFLPATGGLDPRRLDRFRHEAEIIERLAHPNIVRLLSVEHEGKHHFLVMQLIHGISLDRVVGSISTHNTSATDPKLSGTETEETISHEVRQPAQSEDGWLNEKLFGAGQDRFRYIAGLVQQAAQALSYAHSQRIIHRDIKPSNMLIDRTDTLWITDFGLAQIQGEQGLTATGDLLGTLRYMSPEQAMASRIPVDHRTDVYSLGATLYELLCGRAAFQADDRKELLRQVLFDEPPALKKMHADIPVPLQIIVEKAMRKDPRSRYSTAGEMADDLFRFLNDSPIHARRLPFWEPALRWCRRNRALAMSLFTVASLVTLLAAGRFIYLELDERHQETVSLLERTADAEQESKSFARLRDVSRYRQTGMSGLRDRMMLLDLDASSLSNMARSELRNEWLSCMARADWSFTSTIPCQSSVAAISPSGMLIAELANPADPQKIQIRSLAAAAATAVCDPAGINVKAIWFSRGGDFIVATDLASYWQIFRTSDGRKMFDIPQLAVGCDICDSTQQIVFWHASSVVMVGALTDDVSTPSLRTLSIASPASFARFSPNGQRLAVLLDSPSTRFALIDSSDGTVIRTQPAGDAGYLAFSPDGKLIALPNQAGRIIIQDAESTRVVSTLANNESVISAIAWHPSGDYLITSSWTGETLLRHVWTGRVLVRSHEALDAITFSADGRRIGWQQRDGLLRLAEWSQSAVVDLPWDSYNNTHVPAGVSIHPNNRMAAVYSLSGIQLFDLETGRILQRIPALGTLVAEFSDAGDDLILLTRTSIVHWPMRRTGEPNTMELMMGPARVISVPLVQNGVILSGGRRAVVRMEATPDRLTQLDTADGSVVEQFGDSAPGLDVARSGAFILRRGWRHDQADVFDTNSCQKLANLNVGVASMPSASDDGKYFVSSSLEKLQFWNPETWERTESMALDAPVVGANATFHPTEPLIAIRLMPNRVGLIDPETRNVVARIDELEAYWNTANAFSPNGDYFVELSGDPSGARVWKLGQMRRTLAEKGLGWGPAEAVSTTPVVPESTIEDRLNSREPSPGLDSPFVVRLESDKTAENDIIGELNAAKVELTANSGDARLQNMVAWRLLMAPKEFRDDVEALRLARLSSESYPESSAVRNTLGLACYRNGLYAEAEQLLLKNLRTARLEDLTLDLLILSMNSLSTGQPSASETYQAWAEQNFADHPPSDELSLRETRLLFDERTQLTQKP